MPKIRQIAGSGEKITFGVSIPRVILSGWKNVDVTIEKSGNALIILRGSNAEDTVHE